VPSDIEAFIGAREVGSEFFLSREGARKLKMADDKNEDTERSSASKLDPAEERSRYFKKLEKWLQEAYAWQSVAAMFPYYVMSGHVANSTPGMDERESFFERHRQEKLPRAIHLLLETLWEKFHQVCVTGYKIDE